MLWPPGPRAEQTVLEETGAEYSYISDAQRRYYSSEERAERGRMVLANDSERGYERHKPHASSLGFGLDTDESMPESPLGEGDGDRD